MALIVLARFWRLRTWLAPPVLQMHKPQCTPGRHILGATEGPSLLWDAAPSRHLPVWVCLWLGMMGASTQPFPTSSHSDVTTVQYTLRAAISLSSSSG